MVNGSVANGLVEVSITALPLPKEHVGRTPLWKASSAVTEQLTVSVPAYPLVVDAVSVPVAVPPGVEIVIDVGLILSSNDGADESRVTGVEVLPAYFASPE